MENIEEQILSYPHLSAEKKREVEAYVEAHPQWASLLRSVRALEQAGEENGTSASVRRVVRAFVVAHHVEDAPADGVEDHLRPVLPETDEMEALVDAIQRRLRKAEAEIDPVSQFESLTGRSLTEEASPSESSVSSTDASSPASSTSASPSREDSRPSSSVLTRLLDLPMVAQGAGAVLVLFLATYAILFAASWASQSPLDRMATVNVSGQMVESYYSTTTRGAATSRTDDESAPSIYLQALSTLRHAHTSTLGLFPHYKPDSLRKAKTGLKRVLDRTEKGSFLALEAHFYLGKVHLAQRDLAKARGCFRIVVEGEGRRAEDARRILQALDAQSGTDALRDSSSMG